MLAKDFLDSTCADNMAYVEVTFGDATIFHDIFPNVVNRFRLIVSI